jgi:hypothetical protein
VETDVALPEPHQEVRLTMPDGEHVPARVASRDGDELVILMMVVPQGRLGAAQHPEVIVEHAGERGPVLLAGAAVLEDSDLLRLRELHAVEMSQRREYVRVKMARSVMVSLAGGVAPVEACCVDLSGGGMLVTGLEHVPLRARIEFRLTGNPDGPPITGGGTVVRTDPDGKRAIVFDAITEGNRRRLIRFLFDRQREERRRGLQGADLDGR